MFDAVLFDLDGTLLDTLRDLAAACNHTLAAMGLPTHPVSAYRQMVGGGIANLIMQMLPYPARSGNTTALAAELFSRYYTRHMVDYSLPYPGIPELLAALERQDVLMAVASNKAHRYVQPIVERFFPDVFVAVHGQREEVPKKPDPAIVHHILAGLGPGAGQRRVLYVGDSDVDVYTAHNAGLPCCGVLWGFRGREELLAAGADYLVENTAELYKIITNTTNMI